MSAFCTFSTLAVLLLGAAVGTGCSPADSAYPDQPAVIAELPKPVPVVDAISATDRKLFQSRLRQQTANVMSAEEKDLLLQDLRDRFATSNVDSFDQREEPQSIEKKLVGHQSGRPAILMIESGAMPASFFGRFRNRVSGLYKWNNVLEKYQPEEVVYKMDPRADAFYEQLIATPNILVGSDFAEIPSPILRSLAPRLPEQYLAHGELVANTLLEQNPDFDIVFAPHVRPLKKLCRLGNSKAARREFAAHYDHLARELSRLIREHNVKAVNLSHGLSDLFWNVLNQECGGWGLPIGVKEIFVENELKILQALAKENDVLVFQATDNIAGRVMNPNTLENKYLCFEAANIIRVGFMTEANSGIPEFGQKIDATRVYPTQKNALPCIDVIINSGFRESVDSSEAFPLILEMGAKPLSLTYGSGVGMFNMRSMATSWATPHALSLGLFLQASSREFEDRERTPSEIKRLMRGRQFDPALHDQTEMLHGHRRVRGYSVKFRII